MTKKQDNHPKLLPAIIPLILLIAVLRWGDVRNVVEWWLRFIMILISLATVMIIVFRRKA